MGSTFTVELPARLTEEVAVRGEDNDDWRLALAPGEAEWRVLVVDDNPENGQVLSELLDTAGFQHRTAENGARAIELFRQWRPHFIFMDLRMPVMDGFEAVKRIRAMEGGGEVRISAITASVFASQRDEVTAAGMDDLLRKPFRPGEVFDCLARHLPIRFRRTHPVPSPAGSFKLNAASLSAIPDSVRQNLARAIVTLDGEAIASAIEQVALTDPALAAALKQLKERLAYTTLLELAAHKPSEDLPSPGEQSPVTR